MPRDKSAQSAAYFLKKVLNHLPPEAKQPELELFHRCPEIIGADLAQEVILQDIRHGELILKCASSPLKMELRFQKNAILERANAILGKRLITDLRFI